MALLSFKSDPRHAEGARTRERIFLEHYRPLLESALQFTRGQRERAEDLVHDAFVQFQIKEVDVAAIDDVRLYLAGILRNLYLLQLRRANRYPLQQLSLLDHDSADMGLRAQNPIDQLQSADLLVRACGFVCCRKETSVPASVLILRFFHGYFTDEICRITGAQRRQVNKWLARGRSETKSFLVKPYPLSDSESAVPSVPAHTPRTFLAHLRGLIFDSCTTPCAILEPGETSNDTQALAHLVSCPKCLERRTGGLGLPKITERLIDDISRGSDDTMAGGNGTKGQKSFLGSHPVKDDAARMRKAYRVRMRELVEHRPSELSIVFDGETHATLLLTASRNTLNLSLERKQCPDSIGILSDQEVCLLLLDRREIETAERRVYHIPFSDGRSLQVIVVPEFRGPSLQIAYCDPELATAHGGAWHDAAHSAEERLTLVSRGQDAPLSVRNWRRRILRAFPKLEIPTMNPTLATALVLAVVASVLLVVGVQQQRQKTVADLIQRATAADPSVRPAVEPGVIYQKVAIRTTRRTVERTIYRDAQGVRRPRHRRLSAEDEQLRNRLADAGVNWDAPLSAVDYSQWRRRSSGTRDAVTRSGQHLLTLSTTPDADSEVLKETLTVRDTDFHAVDRTIELRDSGIVEIAELSYDVLPWAAASPDWFEPLPGSIAGDAILPALKSHLPQVLSEQVLDRAELEARVALNQLHADTGERIRLARTAGAIHVKGVVDTDVRKRELLSRLSEVPHVEASILSVEEVNSQPQSGSPFENSQPIQVYSVEAHASPLELYLRENKLPIDRLTAMSHSLLDGGLTVQQAQVHFAQLQPRFHAANQLPPQLQGQLATLARNYIEAVSAGLEANDHLLQSIGLGSASAAASPESLSPEGDSDEPMNRYQQLCRELIHGGSAQSRPATVIASELTNAGAQIRRRAAQASATIPKPNDP